MDASILQFVSVNSAWLQEPAPTVHAPAAPTVHMPAPRVLTVYDADLAGVCVPYRKWHAHFPGGPMFVRRPGVFRDAIARRDISIYVNHDLSPPPLASQEDGTLDLVEGDSGLFLYCNVPDGWRQTLAIAAQANQLRGWSIHYYKNDLEVEDSGELVHCARLIEVSLCVAIEPAVKGGYVIEQLTRQGRPQ